MELCLAPRPTSKYVERPETPEQMRLVLRRMFPRTKFRVHPRMRNISGAIVDVAWTPNGPSFEEVKRLIEGMGQGHISCLFGSQYFVSATPGPVLGGACFLVDHR